MADSLDTELQMMWKRIYAQCQTIAQQEVLRLFGSNVRGGALSPGAIQPGTSGQVLTTTSGGQTAWQASSASGLELTDGTTDLTGITKVTVSGGTVGGTSPDATLTITGGGGWTRIGQVIVPSGGQATIDFSSIPQGYQDLRLVFDGTNSYGGTNTGVLSVLANGDTGGNYSYHQIYSAGSISGSFTDSSVAALCGEMPNAGLAPASGSAEILFPNYANTTAWKTVSSRTSAIFDTNYDSVVYLIDTAWRSTAAISSITLQISQTNAFSTTTPANNTNGTFAAGSVATLYGLS